MKIKLSFFFLLFSLFSLGQVPHCGFDFTSYLVVKVHEEGKSDNIPDLKITLVNEKGEEVINENNKYSIIGKTKNAKIANRFDNKNTKRKLSI